MALLDRIHGPADLRQLKENELEQVAAEVRERMIDVVSRVGGHFAPGLGVVELTIALHYIFDTPRDKLVWDVGHQGYPHKILTGRNTNFDRIRQKDGPSGFLMRKESEYDVFGAGHAATSISAALGMATARDLKQDDFEVVAVIGDGAMTSGMAYEALNNAGHTDRDLIVILNDNEMSISRNVGAMHKYLTKIVTNPLYNRVRDEIKNVLASHGTDGVARSLKLEESAKAFLTPGTLFEELGFRYVGPVDGHDLPALLETLRQREAVERARAWCTSSREKGKGFPLAEAEPGRVARRYAVRQDQRRDAEEEGRQRRRTRTCSARGCVELAATHPEMVVITAAMPSGTGTGVFGDAYPDRYFNVGIAEGHAVTFAAGMATRRHRSRSPRSTPRSCSARTTRSSTMSRFRTCRSCSRWIAPAWSAMMARPTWASTTSRICSRCRT